MNLFSDAAQRIFQDSSLQIFAKDIWGSQNPQHRQLMHSEVAKLKESSPSLHVSISHCDGMGVIVCSQHPVGVDIELSARVSDNIVARVSSADDVRLAPSPASLWCAKEACFKALKNYQQPSVISDISIGDWQNIDSQIETCRLINSQDFRSPSENQGVVVHLQQHTCCFFIFHT